MAFKSPGIYYKEVDNTEYTNPAAEINTTVAIVGFAKKGPIGEPIEITSYNSFKSIFGEPITGTYAGLGVRSVLSAGGTVLFVRVADETTASKSNVVIRNGVKEVKGSLIFNHNKTITSSYSNYKNNEVYSGVFSIEDKADTTKTVYLRAPASGNFTINDIQEQLQKQLDNNTNAYEEFRINAKPLTYAPRLFNVEVDEDNGTPTKYGPFVFNPNLEDSSEQTDESNFESVFAALSDINKYNTKLLISNKKLKNFDDGYYLPIELTATTNLVFNVADGLNEPTKITIELADDIKEKGEDENASTYIKVSTLVSRINSGLKKHGIGCNYFVKSVNENEGILYLFVCGEETKQLMPGKITETNEGVNLLTAVPTVTLDQNSLVLNNDEGSESVALSSSINYNLNSEQKTDINTLIGKNSLDPATILTKYINNDTTGLTLDNVSVDNNGFTNAVDLKDSIIASFDLDNALINKLDVDTSKLLFEQHPEVVKVVISPVKQEGELVATKTVANDINLTLNVNVNIGSTEEEPDYINGNITENITDDIEITFDNNYNESFVFVKNDEENYERPATEDYQKSILFDFDAKKETTTVGVETTTSYDCFTKEIEVDDLDPSMAFDKPVEFNKNTVGIVIKDNNVNDTFTVGRSITVKEWNYEEETVDPEVVTYSLNYKFGDILDLENANQVVSEKGLEGCYEVTTDTKKRLCIENKNTEANGYIAPTLGNGSLLNFLSNNEGILTQNEFEEKGFREGNEFALITKEGVSEVTADKSDLIVFTAKEFGSGTSTIGIEIYTVKSPLDDETETHYVELFVDGLRKESWEDVSYDKTAENYFANLINADPDEGGSNYVSVIVKEPKEKESTIIDVPDTSKLSSTGIIYLGKPVGDGVSFESVKGITKDEYDKYDYYLGNDGVPSYQEETTKYINLFANAMNVETSGLSNKDLYSWHILITPDDHQNQDIQDEAINLVEFMEDAIYIVDPPRGLSRDAVINWHNGKTEERITPLESNYACTYWPWVKVYNSIDSKYQYIMPSIIMAAQFCRVDANYAPWYAPAGETNGYCSTALDLEVNSKDNRYPNKTDRDALYLNLNRVNPFLKLRNGNILAFGEKTCQRKNSTLTKIHTRRMLVALKKDLNSVIKGFIFQPTMSENISTIRSNVITIMERYKSGGGVASYNVICDDTNNTTETLQQDILNVAVSCVPTGCIEQVEITLTLNKNAE